MAPRAGIRELGALELPRVAEFVRHNRIQGDLLSVEQEGEAMPIGNSVKTDKKGEKAPRSLEKEHKGCKTCKIYANNIGLRENMSS